MWIPSPKVQEAQSNHHVTLSERLAAFCVEIATDLRMGNTHSPIATSWLDPGIYPRPTASTTCGCTSVSAHRPKPTPPLRRVVESHIGQPNHDPLQQVMSSSRDRVLGMPKSTEAAIDRLYLHMLDSTGLAQLHAPKNRVLNRFGEVKR